jgi:hypothetical protein
MMTESGVLPVKTKFNCLAALTSAPSSVLGTDEIKYRMEKHYPKYKRNTFT